MGPTCEVLVDSDVESLLEVIDTVLENVAEKIDRTRKGRAWNVWISHRPVVVRVIESSSTIIELSAGCNESADYRLLRDLAARIVDAVGGSATDPIK